MKFDSTAAVTYSTIVAARERLAPYLSPTFLDNLGEMGRAKLEFVNPGHSFKIRGALNAALTSSSSHLMTASNGNHGIALAIAGQLASRTVTVVLPSKATGGKRRQLANLDAEVVDFGNSLDEAEIHARQLATSVAAQYVSAYNDPAVVAGAGTIGLEILDQCPEVERIYVPAGGGGLVAGVAVATSRSPEVEVVACCPDQSTALMAAVLERGDGRPGPSIADALVGGIEADSITIGLLRQLQVRFALATEIQIAQAVRGLIERGWLVEPGGSVAAAVAETERAEGVTAVSVISGSNIDPRVLEEILADRQYRN